MKVLITGNLGYVGTVVAGHLQARGHHVRGFDLGYFDGCVLENPPRPDEQINGDVREFDSAALSGVDGLVHLAEVFDDPSGVIDPQVIHEVNVAGTECVARAAKSARLPLVVVSCTEFDSACGAPYRASKIAADEVIRATTDSQFAPISLGFGVPYGYSPRLRVDLSLNKSVAHQLGGLGVSKPDLASARSHVHVATMAEAIEEALAGSTLAKDTERDLLSGVEDLAARLRRQHHTEIVEDRAFSRVAFLVDLVRSGVLARNLRRPSVVATEVSEGTAMRRLYPLW